MATKKFKVGDLVRVVERDYEYEGRLATVTDIDNGGGSYPITVDYGDGDGLDYFEKHQIVRVSRAPTAAKKADQTYRGNGKHTWEPVTNETARLRVPGGWLYKTIDVGSVNITRAVTFVPMPEVVKHAV